MPTLNSPRPERSITARMVRRPSSRCATSANSPDSGSETPARAASISKTRSNVGKRRSTSAHSSTRRAPSISSDSGLMEVVSCRPSGCTSGSNVQIPCVHVKSENTASSTRTRSSLSTISRATNPDSTSSSPTRRPGALTCWRKASSSCSFVMWPRLTSESPSRSRRLTIAPNEIFPFWKKTDPNLVPSTILRQPVFWPSASNCSTSGKLASLRLPRMAISPRPRSTVR